MNRMVLFAAGFVSGVAATAALVAVTVLPPVKGPKQEDPFLVCFELGSRRIGCMRATEPSPGTAAAEPGSQGAPPAATPASDPAAR